MPNGDNPYLEELLQRFYANQAAGGGVYDYNTYAYSGISPEIMQALGNVLDFGDISNFTPGQFNLQDMPFEGGFPVQDEGISYGLESQMYEGGYDPSLEWNEQDISSNEFMINALGLTNIFDPESLAATLSQLGGMEEAIRPGEVKALTPEMIEKTTSAYYDPYETAQRGTLVDKLSKQMGKVGTGGFAGSGGRQAGLSGAEKLYQGGYQDILGDIMKMRGGATENVLDTIYGWSELMSA